MFANQPINFKELFEKFSEANSYHVEIRVGNNSVSMTELDNDIFSVLQELNINSNSFVLPDSIKQQMCLYNKLSVKWYAPSSAVMGSFSFPHLVDMITSAVEIQNKRLYLFDDFMDMWKVYVDLDNITGTQKLYLLNFYEHTLLPMCIGVDTYYEKLKMCLGLTNWQDFFMEDYRYESSEGARVEFEKYFNELLPDGSFYEFIKK